jgi:hypothetical protein
VIELAFASRPGRRGGVHLLAQVISREVADELAVSSTKVTASFRPSDEKATMWGRSEIALKNE